MTVHVFINLVNMEFVFKQQGWEGDINVSVKMAIRVTIVKQTGMSAGMAPVSMEELAQMELLTTIAHVQKDLLEKGVKSM